MDNRVKSSMSTKTTLPNNRRTAKCAAKQQSLGQKMRSGEPVDLKENPVQTKFHKSLYGRWLRS